MKRYEFFAIMAALVLILSNVTESSLAEFCYWLLGGFFMGRSGYLFFTDPNN